MALKLPTYNINCGREEMRDAVRRFIDEDGNFKPNSIRPALLRVTDEFLRDAGIKYQVVDVKEKYDLEIDFDTCKKEDLIEKSSDNEYTLNTMIQLIYNTAPNKKDVCYSCCVTIKPLNATVEEVRKLIPECLQIKLNDFMQYEKPKEKINFNHDILNLVKNGELQEYLLELTRALLEDEMGIDLDKEYDLIDSIPCKFDEIDTLDITKYEEKYKDLKVIPLHLNFNSYDETLDTLTFVALLAPKKED